MVEAINGKNAIQLIGNGLKPDLILSDIMMPEMNGYELLNAIKQMSSTSDIPFVYLSAKASEDEKIKGLRSGADDYLIKPFSAKELLTVVETRVKSHKKANKEN